ncbi:hypothetical protein V6N11_083316 [Hibiscus sabdariffa]|uniref:Uncharacterized protein n=1 Tax=Hibiscus sabdariffa TaxID=183260 RepID=A0ABR2QLM1_9ROSI
MHAKCGYCRENSVKSPDIVPSRMFCNCFSYVRVTNQMLHIGRQSFHVHMLAWLHKLGQTARASFTTTHCARATLFARQIKSQTSSLSSPTHHITRDDGTLILGYRNV